MLQDFDTGLFGRTSVHRDDKVRVMGLQLLAVEHVDGIFAFVLWTIVRSEWYEMNRVRHLRIYAVTDCVFDFEVFFLLAILAQNLTGNNAHIKVLEREKKVKPTETDGDAVRRLTDIAPIESKLSLDHKHFDCFQFIIVPGSLRGVKENLLGWNCW